MKISYINNFNTNFKARYNTQDVIMLATKCPYKNRDTDKIIKSLTGLDIYSKELKDEITPKGGNDAFVGFAIEDICEQRVIEQVPKLKETREEYIKVMRDIMDEKSRTEWIDKQAKKFGKTIKLNPFTITKEEIKKGYEFWEKLVADVQQMLWKMDREGK